MPFNDQGVFDPLDPPAFPAVDGTTIIAEYYNNVIADLIDGLTRTFLRDGLVPMEGNLDLGGNRIVNGAPAVDVDDFTTLEQVETLANQAQLEATMPPGAIQAFACRIPPSGWLLADGSAVSRTTFNALFAVLVASSTITVTIASPAVITWTGHNLRVGDPVKFTTTGLLPTGITAGVTYYVISAGLTANTFRVSATPNGSAVNTSGSQNGTHTGTWAPWGVGDGVTTFNLPDLRGTFLRGADLGRGFDTARGFGEFQANETGAHSHTASVDSQGAHTHTGTASSDGAHQHFLFKNTYTGPAGFTETTNTTYCRSYAWISSAEASMFVGQSVDAADIGLSSSSGSHTHTVAIDSNGAHTHTVTVTAYGTESRPSNYSVTYCIKT